MTPKKEWFGEWFDSPYYHILYKNRDSAEAKAFINKLRVFFNFKESDKILDLACGKGRHSIYLNNLGFDVTGLDLSKQNILAATKFENERLRFFVHDMRHSFGNNKYDYILNLFTSFGYFDDKKDNLSTICAATKALKPDAILLIDFLNPYRIIHKLVPEETKSIEGITFHITRHYRNEFIIKDIRFTNNGQDYHFQEKVNAIRKTEFLEYFKTAGLRVKNIFGGYSLDDYDKEKSERLIFVLKNQLTSSC